MTQEQIKELNSYEVANQLAKAILNRAEAEGEHAWAYGYLHATIGGWMYELPELRRLVARDLERETRGVANPKAGGNEEIQENKEIAG